MRLHVAQHSWSSHAFRRAVVAAVTGAETKTGETRRGQADGAVPGEGEAAAKMEVDLASASPLEADRGRGRWRV